MAPGKGGGCQGEGITRGVSVFSQGEDRIINAQLWIKLKLPARRQGEEVGGAGAARRFQAVLRC